MQNDKSKFKDDFKKRLYSWVLKLIKVIESMPSNKTSEIITKQLLRSGTSVLANYVEASSASSKKDFINFFNYSLKSANESKMWISLLIDTKNGNVENLNALLKELMELSRIVASSIIKMKNKNKI